MIRWTLILALAAGVGCSTLVPKQVEFFQDKVQEFPRPEYRFQETRRQAARMLNQHLAGIENKFLAEGRSPDDVRPVSEAASLADALSTSLGPPLRPFKKPAQELTGQLDYETARYVDDVRTFADSNDKNAGKKIEGTGLVQIGYFSFLAVILFLGLAGYVVLKVVGTLGAAANPAVGLGLSVAQIPARLAGKALGQVLRGGEKFKDEIVKKANWTADEITRLFREQHERAQDGDAQDLVKHLTKK